MTLRHIYHKGIIVPLTAIDGRLRAFVNGA